MAELKHYPIPKNMPASVFWQMVVVLRILGIERMNIREVEKASGISYGTLRHLLPNLRSVGLIGVKMMQRDGRSILPIYGTGGDECLNAPIKTKPKAHAISFKYLIDAMHEPCTVLEIVEQTGISNGAVRRAIKWMMACRIAYGCGYDRDSKGSPVQTFRLGSHPTREKPKRQPREVINRRYRERQAQILTFKTIQLLAA